MLGSARLHFSSTIADMPSVSGTCISQPLAGSASSSVRHRACIGQQLPSQRVVSCAARAGARPDTQQGTYQAPGGGGGGGEISNGGSRYRSDSSFVNHNSGSSSSNGRNNQGRSQQQQQQRPQQGWQDGRQDGQQQQQRPQQGWQDGQQQQQRPQQGWQDGRQQQQHPQQLSEQQGRRQAGPGSGLSQPAAPAPPARNKRQGREKVVSRTTVQQEMQRRKGCCYGCGGTLQITVPLGPGYVPPDKYEQKAKCKQLDKVLCTRCSELCNGAMIPAVEDFTQKLQAQALLKSESVTEEGLELLGKALLTPEQLRTKLMEVSARKALVVLLVDLTDASGTLMSKIRDVVGKNPIVLVGTKMDLLPDGTHPRDVTDWLMDTSSRKGLSVVSCHLVSSHTGEGVPSVTSKICRERKGRDVYVVGAANVGKSAFVRAMLKDMAKFDGGNFDPAALANGKYLPVESAMPGTTLGIIPLRAFESGGTLFDTPGVHLHHRVPHMLSPSELKLLHPRKRLQPIVPLSPLELTSPQQDQQEQDQPPNSADTPTSTGTTINGSISVVGSTTGGRNQLEVLPWDEKLPDGLVMGRGQGKTGGGPAAKTKKAPSVPTSVRASYSWSDLVRVDIVSAPPTTALAFYGPNTMSVTASALPTSVAMAAPPPSMLITRVTNVGGGEEGEGAVSSKGPQLLECAGSVNARGGLVPRSLKIRVDGSKGPLADVAVSGVPGWMTVWAPAGKRDVLLRVWAPRGVEVFLRPPFPCVSPFKGVSDGASDEDDEVADVDVSLQELGAEYEGGRNTSAINDASWWEAAIQELEAFDEGTGKGKTQGEEEEEVWEEEEEERKGRGLRTGGLLKRGGLGARRVRGAAGDGDGERIIMQATVEDILKRPRLDTGFAELDMWGEGEEEEGGARKGRVSGGRRPGGGSKVLASSSKLLDEDDEDDEDEGGMMDDEDEEEEEEEEEVQSVSRRVGLIRRQVPLARRLGPRK